MSTKVTKQKKTKTSSVKKCYSFLQLLSETNNKQRKQLLSIATKDQIKGLCELCLNILRGSFPLKPADIAKLKKHKKIIQALAYKTSRIEDKKELINQRGGFLGGLLKLAVPLLSGLLGAVQR